MSSELPLNGRNATELIFLAGMANVGGKRFLELGPQLSDCHDFGGGRNRELDCVQL